MLAPLHFNTSVRIKETVNFGMPLHHQRRLHCSRQYTFHYRHVWSMLLIRTFEQTEEPIHFMRNTTKVGIPFFANHTPCGRRPTEKWPCRYRRHQFIRLGPITAPLGNEFARSNLKTLFISHIPIPRLPWLFPFVICFWLQRHWWVKTFNYQLRETHNMFGACFFSILLFAKQ